MRRGRNVFRLSLASRLSAGYAALSLLLLVSVLGVFYWRVERHLKEEHQHLLAELIRTLSVLPLDELRVLAQWGREAPGPDGALFAPGRYGFRLQSPSGVPIVETPGMQRLSELFPRHQMVPEGLEAEPRSAASGIYVVLGWRMRPIQGSEEALLVVALDVTEDVQVLGELRVAAFLLGVLAAIGAVVLGRVVATMGLSPLHRLTAELTQLSAGSLGSRLAEHEYPHEVCHLVRAFNELLARLEQAFADLSAYSANLAHELRTPLAALRGEVEVALLGERGEEEYRSVLETLLEELERLARLVEKLLFLARADRRETALHRERLDLRAEANGVLEFFASLAEEKGARLLLEGEGEAFADRDLFRQALANLVSNALEHLSAGGTVRVRVEPRDGGALVTVRDDGCGVDPRVLPFLFQRFPPPSTRRGMGLGLAIVRSIVELHGGHVAASSEPGKGTEIRLWFPRP